MSKFYGAVGFKVTQETTPGVWVEKFTERNYYGDVFKRSMRWQRSENLNDNLTASQQISILADGFAYDNLSIISYVKWMGVAWKVTDFEVQRPRVILTLGDKYILEDDNA